MIGTKIAHYEITELLGQGGMGVVYKATDSRLGRPVAIKILPGTLDQDGEFMQRFEREARTLAALNHPNIGSIYDVQEHGGRKHLILEFVDGDTLADRIARGPLRVGEVLKLGSQIARGLAAAHDAGFIHRDLKPANIKITPAGVAKILDFGLARPVTDNGPAPTGKSDLAGTVPGALTSPGETLGTAPYMSPEQVRGEQTDRRTDLWSLGVVLFECLTGSNPFAHNSAAACMANILNAEPDLESLPAGVPPEVKALIRRCLRKDASLRPRDAGDVQLILDDARETQSRQNPAPSSLAEISDRGFRISDELCRELARGEFDGLLPGWEMRYADNNRDSDTLIVWIPSIGGDHTTSQWRDLIARSPHRMVIVTPVGMEPGVDHRPVVSLSGQLSLIRALTRHLKSRLNPKRTLVSGFSCGSIMALRCAAGDNTGELFDGVLAVDADLQQRDCFMTRLFAGLEASSSSDVVEGLRTLSGACATVHQWLVLHEHLVECVDKFQADFSPLIRQGRDLSVDYDGVHSAADSPFVGFLREALAAADTIHCVFHDDVANRRILGDIRMMHLDGEVLGPTFTEDVISFLAVPDHIGMMSNDRLLEQLDRVVVRC